jgi:hypothetical protein
MNGRKMMYESELKVQTVSRFLSLLSLRFIILFQPRDFPCATREYYAFILDLYMRFNDTVSSAKSIVLTVSSFLIGERDGLLEQCAILTQGSRGRYLLEADPAHRCSQLSFRIANTASAFSLQMPRRTTSRANN